MGKKILTFITLVAVIIYSTSCAVHTTKKKRVMTVADWEGEEIEILKVLKTSGEYIEFPNEQPGRIYKDTITGDVKKEIEIDRENIEEIDRNKEGKISSILTKDGKIYWVSVNDVILEIETKIIITIYESVFIPLSEVELIWVKVKKVDPCLASLGVVVLAFGVAVVIVVMGGGIDIVGLSSCPFIYAFNGETYDLTGEIYGGAIHPPLERHDYLPLPTLKPVDEEYLIKMTNEAREIQHTNLAELLVIDHPLGTEVLIDKYGNTHTLSNLQSPIEAFNLKEEIIYDKIAEMDSLKYMGSVIDKDIDEMDGIILNFNRPLNIKSAKLVIRAKNSFWLDYVFAQFNDLFGNIYKEWMEIQSKAPADELRKWSLSQGIPLTVYIEKDGMWEFVDYFNIVGPLTEKDDVLSIDISDIKSDKVKIKLEYGFLFWEIDYVAMDFSPNQHVHKNVVPIESAIDKNDRDVTDLLLQDDNDYYVQYEFGDEVIMKYRVPKIAKNANRTTILHSKGHYEILRNPQGTPDISYLESFRKHGKFNEFSKERLLDIFENKGN